VTDSHVGTDPRSVLGLFGEQALQIQMKEGKKHL